MKRVTLPTLLALLASLAFCGVTSAGVPASSSPPPTATLILLGAGSQSGPGREQLTRLVTSRVAAGPVALLRATGPASLLVPPTRSRAALLSGLAGGTVGASDPVGTATALSALTDRLAGNAEVVLAGFSTDDTQALRTRLGRSAEGLLLTPLEAARPTAPRAAASPAASAPAVLAGDRVAAPSGGPSPLLLLLGLIAVPGLIAVGVRRTQRQAPGALAGRVAAWTDAGHASSPAPSPAAAGSSEGPRPTGAFLARIQDELALSDLRLSARDLVIRTALGTLALSFVLALVSPFLMPLAFLAGPLAARAFVRRAVRKRREAFAEQLGDTVQAIASAMRAGHGISAAMAMLVDDLPSPAADELRAVVTAERIGVGFEKAMEEAIARTGNRDFQQVAMVAALQRESGGNGAEALDRVVETIRARDDVRRLMQTLTAQGRMSRWVLTALPVGLALAMLAIGDGYLAPLWETPLGLLVSVMSIASVSVGSFWIGRIVEIEV